MELHKAKPKTFVILSFICGIILIALFFALYNDFFERIGRIVGDEIETPKGIYIGELNFGEADGSGEFNWNNGDNYKGNFKGSELNGSGTLIFADGNSYIGDYDTTKRSGSGVFSWTNGNEYSGDWVADKISGDGTVKYKDGSVLKGTFDNGKMTTGTFTTKNLIAEYTLTYEDFKVTDVIIKYSNGNIYEGEYSKGSINGNGIMTYSNGDSYEGHFVDAQKSGDGIYKWANGAQYDGKWANDKMNGTGTFLYPSSSKGYKLYGTFENNLPDGELDYYTNSDTSYETTWSKGKCIKLTE